MGYSSTKPAPAQSWNILALDFDGVICASSRESSYSSILAINSFWPEIEVVDQSEIEIVQNAVMELRPIVETGWENMILARLSIEELRKTGAIDTKRLIREWSEGFRDAAIKKYSVMSKDDLLKSFGDTRDLFIKKDFDHWVSLNEIYSTVKVGMSNIRRKEDFYIITTKQERFVRAIMKKNSLPLPSSSHLFDLENKYGPKPKVLAAILEAEILRVKEAGLQESSVTVHFVEDRFETLLKVAATPGLEKVKLYLADWGYNTEEQRNCGKSHERITVINQDDFNLLLSEIS